MGQKTESKIDTYTFVCMSNAAQTCSIGGWFEDEKKNLKKWKCRMRKKKRGGDLKKSDTEDTNNGSETRITNVIILKKL